MSILRMWCQVTAANRLYLYGYTADGLRAVQQVVDLNHSGSMTTAYTWDWAVPGIPALLQAGDTRYLVGHNTLTVIPSVARNLVLL